MKFKKVTSDESFVAALSPDSAGQLPFWFAEDEAEQFTRSVGGETGEALALLPTGATLEHPDPVHLAGADASHLIVCSSADDVPLARRYAQITGRAWTLWDQHKPIRLAGGDLPRSVTWLPRLDEYDLAERLIEMRLALDGMNVPLSVITGEDERHRSWQLIKQLCPGDGDARTTRIALGRASVPAESVLGTDLTGGDLVTRVDAAEGTLLLAGHSRPYCAIANSTDGPVGLCGTNSAGPQCVGEVRCHFGTAPRVKLDALKVGRAFLDGCTTAGVGGRHIDFPERRTMVCHAALRSSVRELLGNTHIGAYGEADLDWFLGSSALGRSPAEAACLVEVARAQSKRELVPSLVYFGDAGNPAWPVEGVAVAEVERVGEAVRLTFDSPAPILVAEIPSRSWADQASNEVTVLTSDAGVNRVEIVADPRVDASLLISSGRGAQVRDAPVLIELRRRSEPAPRQAGARAAHALARIRWMQALGPFTARLSPITNRIEQDVLHLLQTETQHRSAEFLMMIDAVAGQLSQAADAEMIAEAVALSSPGFRLQNAYASRMRVEAAAEPRTCPRCQASARFAELQDWLEPTIRRSRTTCGFCGIVEDLPTWPLELDWGAALIEPSRRGVRASIRVRNVGPTPRGGLLMASMNSVRVADDQPPPQSFQLEPGEETTVVHEATASEDVAAYLQVRVYIASEGDFGVLAENRVVMAPPRNGQTS